MLHRLRTVAKRWPVLWLALALASLGSQAMATTLDWCLHAGDDAHVIIGGSSHHIPPAYHPQHGNPDAPEPDCTASESVRIPASSDGACPHPSVASGAPFVACWYYLPRIALTETTALDAATRQRARALPCPPRPEVSGAVHGDSARLLI